MTITDILNELGIQYAVHGESKHVTEGWIALVCPWCDRGQGNYGLGINLRSWGVSCWSCGPHTLRAAIAGSYKGEWKNDHRVSDLLEQCDRKKEVYQKVSCGKFTPPDGVGELLPIHECYLLNRGFNVRQLQKLWWIKGVAHSMRAPWSIYIPIVHQGEHVSWTSRSISLVSSYPRYMTASPTEESIHHKDIVYGEDYVRHAIVVVEGPLDVWAVGPGAVCTFGVNYRKAQVARIADYPVRVVCFDSEPKAQKRASQLCNELEAFPGDTHRVMLETGKDAADCSKDEIKELRQSFLE